MKRNEIPSGPGALSGLDWSMASLSSAWERVGHGSLSLCGVLKDRVRFGSGAGKRVSRKSVAFSWKELQGHPVVGVRRVGVRQVFLGFMRLNAPKVSVPSTVSRYFVHISAFAFRTTRLK